MSIAPNNTSVIAVIIIEMYIGAKRIIKITATLNRIP